MVTYLALYRGLTVAEAEVVALTADPALIADFTMRLLQFAAPPERDPALTEKRRAQRRTLELLRSEALTRIRGSR